MGRTGRGCSDGEDDEKEKQINGDGGWMNRGCSDIGNKMGSSVESINRVGKQSEVVVMVEIGRKSRVTEMTDGWVEVAVTMETKRNGM